MASCNKRIIKELQSLKSLIARVETQARRLEKGVTLPVMRLVRDIIVTQVCGLGGGRVGVDRGVIP